MRKFVYNVSFALVLLTVLAPSAFCTATGRGAPPAPDAASTSALLGIACLGLASVRKYLRR
jgi:hypothetical protein